MRPSCEKAPSLFHDLPWNRVPESIGLDDLSVIDRNTELAEPCLYRFHLYAIFLPQLCCHTGTRGFLHGSNETVVNRYSFHRAFTGIHLKKKGEIE
jgi:hypothetical protein